MALLLRMLPFCMLAQGRQPLRCDLTLRMQHQA